MDLFLRSKTTDGRPSWSARFDENIGSDNHSKERTENKCMNNNMFMHSDLMKAASLGMIAVIETHGCDILVYCIPGSRVYMTRTNYGKVHTVYEVDKKQLVPPDKTTKIYVGRSGRILIESLVRFNPFFSRSMFLLDNTFDDKYEEVLFELVVV